MNYGVDLMDKRRIKFCPQCGSHNVEWELPQTWSVWKCIDCGYVGAFIVEDGKIADAIREDYIKSRLKDKKN
jgi:ribosomal protein L37AE/L43A